MKTNNAVIAIPSSPASETRLRRVSPVSEGAPSHVVGILRELAESNATWGPTDSLVVAGLREVANDLRTDWDGSPSTFEACVRSAALRGMADVRKAVAIRDAAGALVDMLSRPK